MLLGPLGAHRFYVGRNGSAMAMLILTGVGFALALARLDRLPVLAQLDAAVPFATVGWVALAVIALWWSVDLFRTAGFVQTTNRRVLHPASPRAYYRGWPAA